MRYDTIYLHVSIGRRQNFTSHIISYTVSSNQRARVPHVFLRYISLHPKMMRGNQPLPSHLIAKTGG